MYEILKALSIRLDTPAQSLTKDAIAQLIIKIVYNSNTSLTKNQILDNYKSIVRCDNALDSEILSILESLKTSELQYNKGRYYLSSSKRDAIDRLRNISESRFQSIIDTYCRPFFSKEEDVKSWLQDALITFFSRYSKEWIADLCYNQCSVIQSIDQVLEQIELRTLSNKSIHCNDRQSLINSFKKILSDKDPDIDALLWEYGTSQFASQLIKNGKEIDKIAISTFSNAICILDTNILIHLALNATDYSKHLNSIERIFQNLGVKVKYFYITKQEYENTISSKTTEILKLFDSYDVGVIEETDNQLIQSAKQLGCRNQEDYERFFKQISTIPSVIDNSIRISLLDNSNELSVAIDNAQRDDAKIFALNSSYRAITNKDKKSHAVRHDVGLIAGLDYLRNTGKYFILTQDSSIINYAKQYPFQNGLPIAIKIETLLNVLAVNNFHNNSENYETLFASIIRQGLQPNSRTFKVEDLYYILDKELHVAQLPKDSVIEIVSDVNRRRLLGEDNESISKELTRKVQGAKFKLKSDYDQTKQELSITIDQRQKAIESSEKGKNELIKKWKAEKSKDISAQIRNIWIKALILIIFVIFISALIIYYEPFISNTVGKIVSATLLDIAISCWELFKNTFPKVNKLKKNRNKIIEDFVEEQIKKTYE